MSWLVLSVLSFAIAMLLFKQFERSKIDNLPAITVNYFVAAACGYIMYLRGPATENIFTAPWFWYAVAIGSMFILLFNLIALTAQRVGVSVATVANKMSVVVPVVVAIWVYNDTLGWLKGTGIALALLAVYLTTKPAKSKRMSLPDLLLVLFIFVGSGVLDAVFNHVAQTHLTLDKMNIFILTTFLVAGTIGLAVSVVKKKKFGRKNLLGGLFLGIPNYGSILFLLFALDAVEQSSQVFPINNMGIVAASAMGAFIIFKEHLSKTNWAGILLAIFAIAMIAFESEILAVFF